MRALKFLVIGMGVLIVAAVITIVVALYNRAAAPGAGKAWRAEIALAGGAIRDYRLDGDRLVVRAGAPGKPDMLYVIHLPSGAVLGTVTIQNGQ
jgi:hypothetical protein